MLQRAGQPKFRVLACGGRGEGGRGELRVVRGESRSGKFGAFGQGGLPGVAWVRSGGWLQLGPGRGRRDGGARVPHLEVVRHWPPPPTSTGLTTNGGGLGVGCPEEAGLKPAPTKDGEDGVGVVRHGPPRTTGLLTTNGGWDGEHLVRVGCQGWLGCGRGVGCCWVPAGDAGMAGEEDGRVRDPPLRRFLLVVLGGFVEGFGAEGHEVVAVAGGPFLGGGEAGEGVLELGHDVAGDEFVAVADLLAVAPLGGHDEQAAEAAAGFVEPMDGGDQGRPACRRTRRRCRP